MSIDNKIEMFIHCGNCLDNRPEDYSPSDWQDLEIGWTAKDRADSVPTLQVFCKRCKLNVAMLPMQCCRED